MEPGNDTLTYAWSVVGPNNDPANNYLVDNGDADHELTGSWSVGGLAGAYGENYHYSLAGSGIDRSTWHFHDLSAGTYEVLVTWLPNTGRATNAPFELYASSAVRTVAINQKVAPQQDARRSGVWFESLGTVIVDGSGALDVVLTDKANGIVIADAVWVRKVTDFGSSAASLQFTPSDQGTYWVQLTVDDGTSDHA